MSGNGKDWRLILLWLVLVKIGYLAAVCGSVKLWPDFDEERFSAINTGWFNASVQSLEKRASGLTRHFATWDARHYLFLSEVGYSKGVKSCAFYPLWPLVIRCLSLLTAGNQLIVGLVLANVFSLAAWTLFYNVTSRRFGESVARWALVYLIIFPGSLFYQFIYSEPLLFLLVMGLWYGLERERFGMAWVAAFLLPLTRAVGVFSVLPIGWHWLMNQPWGWLGRWRWMETERRRLGSDRSTDAAAARWPETVLLAAPMLGLAAYFGLMWVWTESPFEGIEAQKYWGVHSIGNLWDVPRFVLGFFEPTKWHGFRGSVLDRCAFLLLLFCLPLIWRLGKDMVMWTYMLGILPAMSGTFTSYTRFACCAFPVFIALAVFSERQAWRWLRMGLVATFGVLHIVLLWRFVNLRWAG